MSDKSDETANQLEGIAVALAKSNRLMRDNLEALDASMQAADDLTDLLDQSAEMLREVLGLLEDANSVFPETRAFLQSRGLTSIRELDDTGRQEMEAYLLKRFESLKTGN